MLSLPSRERGLKFPPKPVFLRDRYVAPFAGAWIEISIYSMPYAAHDTSLPSRERGLKFPRATASAIQQSRSLRGSVD